MRRLARGPMLLIVAGILLLLAIIAYLINDAQDRFRQRLTTVECRALDAQTRRSIAELKALREEDDRMRRDRTSICAQQEEILKSVRRIERLMGGAAAIQTGH